MLFQFHRKRGQDTDLQWFQWAGKYFKELCLIFGARSSAGIFDEAAKVVLELVCLLANFPLEKCASIWMMPAALVGITRSSCGSTTASNRWLSSWG